MDSIALKALWAAVLGWLSSLAFYFAPVTDYWWSVSIIWVINFAFGVASGVILSHEHIDRKKAGIAVLELLLFLVVTAAFLVVGRLMGKEDSTMKGLNIVTWSFIWYFTQGLMKNWSRLFPRLWPIRYIYYLLSFECAKYLPRWKEFNKNKPV